MQYLYQFLWLPLFVRVIHTILGGMLPSHHVCGAKLKPRVEWLLPYPCRNNEREAERDGLTRESESETIHAPLSGLYRVYIVRVRVE